MIIKNIICIVRRYDNNWQLSKCRYETVFVTWVTRVIFSVQRRRVTVFKRIERVVTLVIGTSYKRNRVT